MKKVLFVVTLLLLWASFAFGQRDNIDTFSVADTHEFDTVNLITLIPSFNFPGQSKSHGALVGSWQIEVPGGCYTVTQFNPGAQTFWTCSAGWYFGGQASGYTSRFLFMNTPLFAVSTNYTTAQFMMGMTLCTKWNIFGMYDADGTAHPFSGNPAVTLFSPSSCGIQTKTLTTEDGTGYTVSWSTVGGNLDITSAYDTSGNQGLSDPFGNTMTYALNGSSQLVFTDSLGAAMTQTATGQDSADPSNYQYTDANGSTQNIALTIGSAQSFVPRGSNSCVNYPSSPFTVHPVTKITYPDSTSFGITWDTNGTGISGLIGSVTLRTGGSITYTYGSIASGCGPLEFTSLTRATADGNTTYSTSISGTTQITTVLDPGKNKLVYTFYVPSGTLNSFITLIDRYQNTGTVASPTYTHISETSYCYNNPTTCSTQTPSYPITQLDTYQYTYNGATQVQMSHDEKLYDSTYGFVTSDANTDSINSQTITTTYVYGTWNGTSCVAITNTHVVDHPCTITTKNGTTQLAYETFTYNSNGAPTASTEWISSTDTLTTNYTANSNGTMATKTLPNGQVITNTFGNCNNLLLTDSTTTVNSVAIDNKATWNCNGAVVTDTTDPNSNEDDYAYDSMNRISSYTDRLENVTSYAYGTPTLDHVKITDPLSVVSYVYNDGLGRPTNSQVCQTTGCSNLDTHSKSYAWNGTNFETKTYVPCVKTTLNSACTTVALTSDVNPIAGPTLSTDANSGTLTYAVNSKDFSVTAGPAPTGEHTKVFQTEIDGFGRVTSTCALQNTGGTSCGQTMGNAGILTSNVYSFATGAPKVVTTNGSQSHTTIADAIGRTSSVQTPEAGTVTYLYDSDQSTDGCGNRTAAGDLLKITKQSGNYECHITDGLHRVTDRANNVTGSGCQRWRYDSTANKYQNAPTGYPSSGNNLIGRLMEAETDSCNSTAVTDEWFAYDKMGRITDMWESTPNSGGYYHTTVAYDADGVVTSLTSPFSTVTYGNLDGEDRPTSMTYGSTTIVSATAGSGFTYDAASRPTNIPIGTAGNQDAFTWDNLGNMLTYTFNVGTKADGGTLTWNSNGSLGKLVINDTIASSTDSQSCAYSYDDVARLTGVTSPSGSTCNATETYAYDQYDNMWQSGAFSYACSTCYSSSTNEQTGTPTLSYDSDGNTTNDGNNTYTWNAHGLIASARAGSFAAVCGTSGTCNTYDAMGNLVEQVTGSTNQQFLYSPIGQIGVMNGQTTSWAHIPAPGRGYLFVVGTTPYFDHVDWLGTERLVDTVSGSTIDNDQAYTPYGQEYNTLGSAFALFTGDPEDLAGLWHTPNRELSQAGARWFSPDPAHSGWNAYAYPTDPNTGTDRSGLQEDIPRPDTGNQLVTADDWAYSGMYRSGIWNNPDVQPGGLWWLYSHAASPVASTYNLPESEYDLSSGGSWSWDDESPADFYATHKPWWIERVFQPHTEADYAAQMGMLGTINVGGGEWTTPTFEVFQPSEDVLRAARGFAKEYPQYANAVCGDCGRATMQFMQYAMDRGVFTKLQIINQHAGEPLFEAATNPIFDYTVVYGREGLYHAVNLTQDGKWIIDMSATQFLADGHLEVSYPMIRPVDLFNLLKK